MDVGVNDSHRATIFVQIVFTGGNGEDAAFNLNETDIQLKLLIIPSFHKY